jgi:GNAT superfamily N-acetyltransferase
MKLTFEALTPEHWPQFEKLFGERGACGGCWCMLWRLAPKEFEAQKGSANKQAMKAIVQSGEMPGVLAFADDKAIGWCALAPRETYPSLGRSRVLKAVDDKPVWSVSCLFIDKSHRKQGVSSALLRAAAEHARAHGATLVEGYPVEPKAGQDIPAAFAWTGIPKAFRRAGFTEVARRSATRPIMRLELE